MQPPQSPRDDLQTLTLELDAAVWLRPEHDGRSARERRGSGLDVWLAVLGSLLGVGGYLLLG